MQTLLHIHKYVPFFLLMLILNLHKLPIETGRWNNIDSVNRICTKCDNITIGDEYHYIMECEHFSNFRNRFIVTNLRERPNILKFKQIMSAYQKQI